MNLNRNVILREFGGGMVYLENQVTHLRAWLKDEDAEIVKALPNIKSNANKLVLQKLRELWFIDQDEDGELRDFSYSRKTEIENLAVINNPWEKPLQHDDIPWLNNLQIELTDSCNERCIHCYMPESLKDRSDEMDFDTVKNLLVQYRAMNGVKVVFSGGEIFLHKDLFKILELCRKLGLFVLLQTNLLILTSKILDKLKRLRIFNIQVSLYSTDPAIHDSITTKKGSCVRTMANIIRLVEADIPIIIACPVMKQNFDSIADVQAFADSLGVEVYYDYIMMAQSDGLTDKLNHRISLSQTREMIDFLLEHKDSFRIAIETAGSVDELVSKQFVRRRNICSILSSGLCVSPDGTVYPCPGWKDFSIGDLAQSTLSSIWSASENARKLRAVDMESDFEKCRNCTLRNFCDMCAVYNYNESGDMYNVSQRFCDVAAIFQQAVIDKFHLI